MGLLREISVGSPQFKNIYMIPNENKKAEFELKVWIKFVMYLENIRLPEIN